MAGVYGVLAYLVTQRRRDVLRLVVLQGMGLAVLGLLLGLAGSIAGRREVSASLLYDVKPGDPLTYVAVVGALGLATFAASYLPARRAARIDPLLALRQD